MSFKTLKILLVISLIFNIAFIGNYLYHRYVIYPKHIHNNFFMMRGERMKHFREMRRRFTRQRLNYLRERREFLRMLQSPEYTSEQLRAKLNETIEKEMKMERKIGEDFIEMRKNMSSEEARRFFNNLRKRQRRIRK